MTNEEFIALVKKNPISFGCGAFAVLLAVATFYRGDKIPDAEEMLATRSALSEKYTLNITNSAQLKEQFDEMVAAGKAIDARMIRASQLGINTQFFYRLERETGVKLLDPRQTSPSNVSKGKTAFVPVAFSVAAQGTLPQLLEFLRQIEGGPHFSRILSANIASNPALRGGPLTLNLSLELLGQP